MTSGYSGGTIVSAGTLAVSASGALGFGPVTVDSELDLSGANITLTNDFTLNSTGNAIVNVSGSNTIHGDVTLAANAAINVVDSTDTLTLNGVISESGSSFGMTLPGAGTLEYTGTAPNTYTGRTTVSAGTLCST